MKFTSTSQCGQDQFVYDLLGFTEGTFLDIGCSGEENSNTLGLERIGWRGLLVDRRDNALDMCPRLNPFLAANATEIVWTLIPGWIDYLSLDVDSDTLSALLKLPLDTVRFRVITIEHDEYAYPNGGPRERMREILASHKYELICGNVMANGVAFEDWWVDPRFAVAAQRFKQNDVDWHCIFL